MSIDKTHPPPKGKDPHSTEHTSTATQPQVEDLSAQSLRAAARTDHALTERAGRGASRWGRTGRGHGDATERVPAPATRQHRVRTATCYTTHTHIARMRARVPSAAQRQHAAAPAGAAQRHAPHSIVCETYQHSSSHWPPAVSRQHDSSTQHSTDTAQHRSAHMQSGAYTDESTAQSQRGHSSIAQQSTSPAQHSTSHTAQAHRSLASAQHSTRNTHTQHSAQHRQPPAPSCDP